VDNHKDNGLWSHHPSLTARPRSHLLEIGRPDLLIHPRHFSYLQSWCFTRVADMTSRFKTTAAVFCLPSSRSSARSTFYSRQAGVPSCRRQHVERPSAPRHILTVTRGLQAASQTSLFPIPGHPDMTWAYLLFFSGILCERCNNWHYLATLNMMMIWWWWWWWCRMCNLKTKMLKFSGSGRYSGEAMCSKVDTCTLV